MIQKDLETELITVFKLLKSSAEEITSKNDKKSVSIFKKEMKTVKALIQFVCEHKGESALKLPDKCRKLYNITGAMEETIEQLETYQPDSESAVNATAHLNKLFAEWKKSYEPSLVTKLEKQMLTYKYGGIPVTLMHNFLNNFFSKTV
jgi:hypothetical protein